MSEGGRAGELLVVDGSDGGGAFGIEDGVYFFDDAGGLGFELGVADFQLEVDGAALASVDANADLFDGRKAFEPDFHFVEAGRQVHKMVTAVVAGLDLLRAADELLAADGDGDAGQTVFGAFDGHETSDAAAELADCARGVVATEHHGQKQQTRQNGQKRGSDVGAHAHGLKVAAV